VADLESVLAGGGGVAMEVIRSLIERVVLTPCPSGAGVTVVCGKAGGASKHSDPFYPSAERRLVTGAGS